MKLSKEKRKEILLSSFEVLNENYYDNRSEIADIINKMLKIDISTALEMWEYLLKAHTKIVINQNECYYLTSNIMYRGERDLGESEFAEIVLSHPFIKKNMFELSGSTFMSASIVRTLIISNQIPLANELIELLDKNPYKEDSLFGTLDRIIPSDNDEISEDAYNCLMSWIDKIENKQEKTKLNLKMLSFIEE